MFADKSGSVLDDNDFYPWGGVIPGIGQTTSTNHYKFTGKERDSESQLDYFGARYYGNAMGRFMSPDWDAKPAAVPYAVLGDPQSLNLYSYVRNSPVVRVDVDGHWAVNICPSAVNPWAIRDIHEMLSALAQTHFVEQYNKLQAEKKAKDDITDPDPADLTEPSWTQVREYVGKEAQAYGVPVTLAEAFAHHESGFDIHLVHKNSSGTVDYGVMQVNSSNTGRLRNSAGFGFKVDMERVKHDWKYNVHVGMALLRDAYVATTLNSPGASPANVARETYARYNSRHHWSEYTIPGSTVNQHVEQFMKSWRLYNP